MQPTIPPREPYEAEASLDQKNLIWKFGFREQATLDQLGKNQATAIIEQFAAAGRREMNRRKARTLWRLGLGGMTLGFGSCAADFKLHPGNTTDLFVWGSLLFFAGLVCVLLWAVVKSR